MIKENTQASEDVSEQNVPNNASIKGSIRPWDNQEELLRQNFNPTVTFVFNPEGDQKHSQVIVEDPLDESPKH